MSTRTTAHLSRADKKQQQRVSQGKAVLQMAVEFNVALNNPDVSNIKRYELATVILWANAYYTHVKPQPTDVERATQVKSENQAEFDAHVVQISADWRTKQ